MEFFEFLFRANLTIKQVAKDTGISANTLSHLKNGVGMPSLMTALLIHSYTMGKVGYKDMIPGAKKLMKIKRYEGEFKD